MDDCADGGCFDSGTDFVNWDCLALCAAPKKNTLANDVISIVLSLLPVEKSTVLMDFNSI
jgi:hypothetical protein